MANLRNTVASTIAPRTIATDATLTSSFPDSQPAEMRQLLSLSLHEDPEVSAMACQAIRTRLDQQRVTQQEAAAA